LHIVHVSSGAGVAAVVEGRARGIDVTCETCPHYLFLTDQDAERIGAAAKCAPPLRPAVEKENLRQALDRGEVLFVASDHSPAPLSMKTSPNFFEVWGGVAGVQTTLGLLLDAGLSPQGIGKVLGKNPAARFDLASKGRVEVGCDADLVLVDLAKSHTLTADELRYRHKISPFVGHMLRGEVRRTLVRGRTVFAEGHLVGPTAGRFVRPQKAPR
jgi:allantoinase